MFFSEATRYFDELLIGEGFNLKDEIKCELIKFISKMTSYEEEEVKIKPHIYLANDFHNMIGAAPFKIFTEITEIELEPLEFGKKLKSLIPFCLKSWIIVLEFTENSIKFSIIRYIAEHRSESQQDILMSLDYDENEFKLFSIRCINTHQIEVRGMRGSHEIIDFNLYDTAQNNRNVQINDIVNDFLKSTEEYHYDLENGKQLVGPVIQNFFKIALDNIHGTIILIVDEEMGSLDEISTDRVKLNNPIKIRKYAENTLHSTEYSNSVEEYYTINGLFMNFLDVDGITVLNTFGEVVAYNLFFTEDNCPDNVVGGARKRAAMNLICSSYDQIVSVYFQSQDGTSFYQRRSE